MYSCLASSLDRTKDLFHSQSTSEIQAECMRASWKWDDSRGSLQASLEELNVTLDVDEIVGELLKNLQKMSKDSEIGRAPSEFIISVK